MTEIWLVRHGETTANATGVWQGQGSAALSERGRLQAAAVGERLARTPFDVVLASDLERTRATALAAGLRADSDRAWREMDIGRWEGLTREEVFRRYPDELQALASGEDIPMGGGETWGGFCARVDGALAALHARLRPAERALVVTHGGTIHTLVAALLRFRARGRPWPLEHGHNTAVTVLVDEGSGLRVRSLNDAAHLGTAPVPDGATTVVGLARHGESEANTVGIWHGITDGPLSPRGREQGEELSARYDTVDHLYSSHLQRARLTAAAFGTRRGLEPTVRPDLHEMSYGNWEGLTSEQIQGLFPDDWAANYVHGGDEPRGRTGETAAGAAARMRRAVEEIAAAHPGARVLAFSHGGAIRACVGGILGLGAAARDLLESPGNASVTHLRVGPEGIVVIDYNTGVA
ncbi:MAG: histidine phosphatase family protein [Acidimicrobiia bacterium]|nr:histidine phosphatase family protein [Acidimicrobiia bacterium]